MIMPNGDKIFQKYLYILHKKMKIIIIVNQKRYLSLLILSHKKWKPLLLNRRIKNCKIIKFLLITLLDLVKILNLKTKNKYKQ